MPSHHDMFRNGFATPEEAASSEAEATALATAISPDDEFAVVLLPDTTDYRRLPGLAAELPELLAERAKEMPRRQLALCVRLDGRWVSVGGSVGNGLAWSSTSIRPWEADPFASMRAARENLGVAAYAAPAPPDALQVVLHWNGAVHRAPTSNGWFLFTAWNISEAEPVVNEHAEPQAVAYVAEDGSTRPLRG